MHSNERSLKHKTYLISPEAVEKQYIENRKNDCNSRRNLILTNYLCVYTLIITSLMGVKASFPPSLITFTNDNKGYVSKVTPNRNPPVTDRQAIHWAKDKVSDLLSLHFKKYSEQIRRRRDFFVDDGWTLYQQSLIDNEVIETIKSEGLIITAINKDEPRLLEKYMLNGNINWRLEIPILQTIQGASDTSSTVKKIVSVTLEQTRRDESLEGLKVRVFGVIE
ncbi:DotI/IcmL family type IV secretion protein [Microbulbifer epialgicus]|uniref:DotI/IcmL family type IV secretion protein n=1 Tax=Microbulbifer epialgicus TaxID=393907 RepID=A0ABV4NV85_9GAMM